MRAQPLNEHDLSPVVCGHYQPVRVPLDVKHDSITAHDAGIGVVTNPLPFPVRPLYLMKPCIQSRFNGLVFFAAPQ